jgi:hypothetical protein
MATITITPSTAFAPASRSGTAGADAADQRPVSNVTLAEWLAAGQGMGYGMLQDANAAPRDASA